MARPRLRPAAALTCCLVAATAAAGCVRTHQDPEDQLADLSAAGEVENERRPTGDPGADAFLVTLNTTAGSLTVRVRPDWAPEGAARFREMVETGYLDDVTIFRVEPEFVVQFGLSGDPAKSADFRDRPIPDEPVLVNNTRGTMTFAKSNAPDSASSQVFISLDDNEFLNDKFSPFAEVVEGLDEFEANVFTGYVPLPPDQMRIMQEGEAYLQEFPKLTRITSARVAAPAGPRRRTRRCLGRNARRRPRRPPRRGRARSRRAPVGPGNPRLHRPAGRELGDRGAGDRGAGTGGRGNDRRRGTGRGFPQ